MRGGPWLSRRNGRITAGGASAPSWEHSRLPGPARGLRTAAAAVGRLASSAPVSAAEAAACRSAGPTAARASETSDEALELEHDEAMEEALVTPGPALRLESGRLTCSKRGRVDASACPVSKPWHPRLCYVLRRTPPTGPAGIRQGMRHNGVAVATVMLGQGLSMAPKARGATLAAAEGLTFGLSRGEVGQRGVPGDHRRDAAARRLY